MEKNHKDVNKSYKRKGRFFPFFYPLRYTKHMDQKKHLIDFTFSFQHNQGNEKDIRKALKNLTKHPEMKKGHIRLRTPYNNVVRVRCWWGKNDELPNKAEIEHIVRTEVETFYDNQAYKYGDYIGQDYVKWEEWDILI
jgi:hypothetical protein